MKLTRSWGEILWSTLLISCTIPTKSGSSLGLARWPNTGAIMIENVSGTLDRLSILGTYFLRCLMLSVHMICFDLKTSPVIPIEFGYVYLLPDRNYLSKSLILSSLVNSIPYSLLNCISLISLSSCSLKFCMWWNN